METLHRFSEFDRRLKGMMTEFVQAQKLVHDYFLRVIGKISELQSLIGRLENKVVAYRAAIKRQKEVSFFPMSLSVHCYALVFSHLLLTVVWLSSPDVRSLGQNRGNAQGLRSMSC